MPDDVPFGKAEEAYIALDKHIVGGTEGYLDDGAVAVVDGQDNKKMAKRAQWAVPMSLHLTFQPSAGAKEPTKQPDPASIRKMFAEGRLREIITFLG